MVQTIRFEFLIKMLRIKLFISLYFGEIYLILLIISFCILLNFKMWSHCMVLYTSDFSTLCPWVLSPGGCTIAWAVLSLAGNDPQSHLWEQCVIDLSCSKILLLTEDFGDGWSWFGFQCFWYLNVLTSRCVDLWWYPSHVTGSREGAFNQQERWTNYLWWFLE